MTNWRDHPEDYAPQVRVKLKYGACCLCCAHFIGRGNCEAFPRGIPWQILEGEHDHRTKPFPGDRGIMWRSTLRAVEVDEHEKG